MFGALESRRLWPVQLRIRQFPAAILARLAIQAKPRSKNPIDALEPRDPPHFGDEQRRDVVVHGEAGVKIARGQLGRRLGRKRHIGDA